MLGLGLEIAFGALAAYVLADMFAKSASEKLGAQKSALAEASFSLLPMLILAYFLGVTSLNTSVVILSAVSGIVAALGWFLTYETLETEQVSNTISLSGIYYAMTILFGLLVLKEKVTFVEDLCIIAILVGTFLATTKARFKLNKKYVPAIAGQIILALSAFLLIFALQISGGIFTPLIIGGSADLLTMAIYFKIRPENTKRLKAGKVSAKHNVYGALLGIFQGLGTTGFLALAYVNFLAVGYAIASTEAGFVIILGYLFYKDRFKKHQILGLMLLVLGAVAISIA